MAKTNFLIGRGELLTSDIPGPKRVPGKAEGLFSLRIETTFIAANCIYYRKF